MFQILIVLLILVLVFHFFIFHQYNWPSYVKRINKIPGPKGVFYFGSTLRFYTLKNEELLPDLVDSFKLYGSTYRHWYSGIACVFISEIDDVQTVLSSRLNNYKGTLYKNILPWLGNGLLTSSGQKWHMMRKIITPTFHFSILQGYIDIFNKNASILLKQLEAGNKEDVNLANHITYCALDNVCETAMGTSLNSQQNGSNHEYVYAVFRIGKIVVERMFSPFYFTDRNFWMSSMGREHTKLLKTLHGFTSRIIEEKKELQSVKGSDKNSPEVQDHYELSEDNIYKRRSSFLEMLLQNQEKNSLTAKEIREEVDTFMFEGHDTTAAALTWSLFELGHHPEIQEQVYDELNKIFGDSDRPPTYQDLMDMTYLKRVIQEALRLYPSVPVISRRFETDIQLRDYLIPAHTEIVLIVYHIHRNPEIFPDPEKFDPDRFLPDAVEKRHPFAYIPFSAGQRNCVGQRFAMLEELVVLSSIIRNYKIESLDERDSVKVVPEMILRPHTKLRWRITKR